MVWSARARPARSPRPRRPTWRRGFGTGTTETARRAPGAGAAYGRRFHDGAGPHGCGSDGLGVPQVADRRPVETEPGASKQEGVVPGLLWRSLAARISRQPTGERSVSRCCPAPAGRRARPPRRPARGAPRARRARSPAVAELVGGGADRAVALDGAVAVHHRPVDRGACLHVVNTTLSATVAPGSRTTPWPSTPCADDGPGDAAARAEQAVDDGSPVENAGRYLCAGGSGSASPGRRGPRGRRAAGRGGRRRTARLAEVAPVARQRVGHAATLDEPEQMVAEVGQAAVALGAAASSRCSCSSVSTRTSC